MKKRDKSRYAILGILSQKPSSGYDIGRMMQQSTNHFWQESDASIYPMLKTLEVEGKVKAHPERTGKRKRTIFEITPEGKNEFAQWMATPPEKETYRKELLLKLFFGSSTTKQQLLKHLQDQLEKELIEKREYESIDQTILAHLPDDHPYKEFWRMTQRYGIIHTDAHIMWINECLNILQSN